MESQSNNRALTLFKALKSMADQNGEVQMEMSEVCRAAHMDEDDVRECLADLENERFITTAITCRIAKEWR